MFSTDGNKPAWMKGSSGLLFSLPLPEIMRSVLVSIGEESNVAAVASAAAPAVTQPKAADDSGTTTKPTCLACGLSFATRAEQSAHFKTDAHRASLQRRINGGSGSPACTASTCGGDRNDDEDEEDDNDEEEDEDEDGEDGKGEGLEADEDAEEGNPEAGWWLRRDQPTVCVIGNRGGSGGEWAVGLPVALVAPTRKVLRLGDDYFGGSSGTAVLAAGLRALAAPGGHEANWAVLLLRSGRFAAGIFQGNHLVHHRVLKRYTTRRGQGGSQAAADGTGKAPKSAGASLRRHGEAMLAADVRALLGDTWRASLASCSLIFVAAPRTMLPVLFGAEGGKGTAPLDRADPRLRPAPATAKPTLEAVKDAHRRLATVDFYPCAADGRNPPRPRGSHGGGGGGASGGGGYRKPEPAPPKAQPVDPGAAAAAAEPEAPAPPLFAAAASGDLAELLAALAALGLRGAVPVNGGEGNGGKGGGAGGGGVAGGGWRGGPPAHVLGGGAAAAASAGLEARHGAYWSTALHAASGRNRADLVGALLEAGASPEVRAGQEHSRVRSLARAATT